MPEKQNFLHAGLTPRSVASRKVVYCEVCTEVSDTANVCPDEQKLNKRHVRKDKVAQHTKVQSVQNFLHVDSAGVNTKAI